VRAKLRTPAAARGWPKRFGELGITEGVFEQERSISFDHADRQLLTRLNLASLHLVSRQSNVSPLSRRRRRSVAASC